MCIVTVRTYMARSVDGENGQLQVATVTTETICRHTTPVFTVCALNHGSHFCAIAV